MRAALIGIGVLLVLAGAIWTLQGLNVLLGSLMSGEPFWVGAGLAAAMIGIGLIVAGLRRPRTPGSA